MLRRNTLQGLRETRCGPPCLGLQSVVLGAAMDTKLTVTFLRPHSGMRDALFRTDIVALRIERCCWQKRRCYLPACRAR